MGEPGVGRMRDRLLLDSGIYRNPFEIFGVDRPGAVGHREALLQQRGDSAPHPAAGASANRESQTARKPACTPGFLAKSITCSGQIIAIDQSLPNSSRTTSYTNSPSV